MGSGIAEVFPQAGFRERLADRDASTLEHARSAMANSLGKFVEKGKLRAANRDEPLSRVHMTASLDELADADYLVEAIVEQVEAKRKLFSALDAIARPEAIFASNASSISLTMLGSATTRGDR